MARTASRQPPDIGGLYRFEPPGALGAERAAPMGPSRLLPPTRMLDGKWAGVASSPVIHDDVIYFGASNGKIYAVGIRF